ncbi:hypothetical protein GGI43DRAFT_409438, partial [Trichoderma evansii]
MMSANYKVPKSLKYYHDRVDSDHDRIGLFQQRAYIYKDIKCDMDASCSAGQFFSEMKEVNGWQSMNIGTLCQKIQRAASPGHYAKQVNLATSICNAGGL